MNIDHIGLQGHDTLRKTNEKIMEQANQGSDKYDFKNLNEKTNSNDTFKGIKKKKKHVLIKAPTFNIQDDDQK